MACGFFSFLLFTAAVAVPTPGNWGAAHNKRRCLHGAPDLIWQASIMRAAQNHANNCKFKHSDHIVYGENLYAAYFSPTAEDVLDGFYDQEIDLYPWDNPSFYLPAGHFSQVVLTHSPTHTVSNICVLTHLSASPTGLAAMDNRKQSLKASENRPAKRIAPSLERQHIVMDTFLGKMAQTAGQLGAFWMHSSDILCT